ncbi:MAG: AsmA family protein, partial [Chitinophagales bacterium]|nr:AsmA family protein [Chitinophagales bacterium]
MFKKIAIGFFIFFVLLIGTAIAIPFLFKDKINALIKEQINKELLADVDYGSYDLSIIKSFPDLYFTLNDLQIVGRDEFAGDTLAKIEKIGFGMELMKFIRSEELLINAIDLVNPKVVAYTLVTEAGDTISNFDIMPPSESEEDTSSLIDITVNDVSIKDGNVLYKDFTNGMELLMKNLNMDANVDYKGNLADVLSKFTIDTISFNDGSMQYLNKTKIDANINATADLENNIYTLKENTIQLNALKIHADGLVSLPDENTTTVDLKFAADKSTFKELISLIPAYYMKDYKDLEANGQFDLSGFAKGNITETETPAFNINLSIADGSIKYPDLPSSVSKINLKANVKNTTSNIERTEIDIPAATFNVAGQDIAMRLNAKNALGDALVDLAVKGKLPLSKIPEFYPLEGVNKIDGMVDADFAFKGLLSQVENEKYDEIDFTGKLDITNLVLDAVDLPMAVKADKFLLNFTPQKAALTATNTVLGQSDFNITGNVENIINYVLADGMIKGNLAIQSNNINLDELLGSEESTSTETASEPTKVPDNVDFDIDLKANKVLYDGLELNNVAGDLTLADETATLKNLQANLLGGSAKIAGAYSTKNT